jgi:hypothetical protein
MKCLSCFLIILVCNMRNNKNCGNDVMAFQLSSSRSMIGGSSNSQSMVIIKSTTGTTTTTTSSLVSATRTPEEERAAALSDYLAKAHEEKLRVINETEQKKNQEINQLKQQIAEMKSTATSSSSSSAVVMVNGASDAIAVKALEDMNKDELLAKILQYQTYMRQYMVNAQEQKYRAVKEAEVTAQQKLSASLSLLGLSPATTAITTTTTVSVTESPLYTVRNVAVANAAAAGRQSRWGSMEVQRVLTTTASSLSNYPSTTTDAAAVITSGVINGRSTTQQAISTATTIPVNGASAPVWNMDTTTTPMTKANSPSLMVVPIPPEVEAADHGLRSDGSIGGLTLAERIHYGSNADSAATRTVPVSTSLTTTSTTGTAHSVEEQLYHQRNVKVVRTAQAGVSNRWGAQEVDRVSNIVTAMTNVQASTTKTTLATAPRVNVDAPTMASIINPIQVPVPPEVEAADHGLRSDGSVGGLTLAERIYFGSNADTTTTTTIVAPATSSLTSSTNTANSVEEMLYNQRNLKVVRTALAGVSNRWGAQEVDRVSNIVTTAVTNVPNVQNTPPQNVVSSFTTTTQRVNFGASILGLL